MPPHKYTTTEPILVQPDVLGEILDKLKSLDEAIRGNGKPGLNERYVQLKAEFDSCRGRREFEQQNKDKIWNRLIHPAVVIIYSGIALLLVTGFGAYMSKRMQIDIKEQVQMIVQEQHGRSIDK